MPTCRSYCLSLSNIFLCHFTHLYTFQFFCQHVAPSLSLTNSYSFLWTLCLFGMFLLLLQKQKVSQLVQEYRQKQDQIKSMPQALQQKLVMTSSSAHSLCIRCSTDLSLCLCLSLSVSLSLSRSLSLSLFTHQVLPILCVLDAAQSSLSVCLSLYLLIKFCPFSVY